MLDIIIAFLAAEGLPALALFCRVRRTGLLGDAGVFAALQSLGYGSVLIGLGCLLLIQLLAIGLVMGGFLLYYHWKYRKVYDSADAAGEAADGVGDLPVSVLMKHMVVRHIGREFARRLLARVAEKRRQNGLQ